MRQNIWKTIPFELKSWKQEWKISWHCPRKGQSYEIFTRCSSFPSFFFHVRLILHTKVQKSVVKFFICKLLCLNDLLKRAVFCPVCFWRKIVKNLNIQGAVILKRRLTKPVTVFLHRKDSHHRVHFLRVPKPWCTQGSPQITPGLPYVNCKLSRGEPWVHWGWELSGGGLWLHRTQQISSQPCRPDTAQDLYPGGAGFMSPYIRRSWDSRQELGNTLP